MSIADKIRRAKADLDAVKNKGYNEGYGDGFEDGKESVPDPKIEALKITENGTYTAPDGVDGFSPVVVSVVPRTETVIEITSKNHNRSFTNLSKQTGDATWGELMVLSGYATYWFVFPKTSDKKILKLSGVALGNYDHSGVVRKNIGFTKNSNTTVTTGKFAEWVTPPRDVVVIPDPWDADTAPDEYIIEVPGGLDIDGIMLNCIDGGTPVLKDVVINQVSYDTGYKAGNYDTVNEMMDALTDNGARTEYRYAFASERWTDELFKPHTVIKPTNFQNGLYKSKIGNNAYTDLLDFSNCQNLSAAFMYSTVKMLKVIDARKTTSGFNGMSNMLNNCSQLESVDEFYPSSGSSKANFQNTFTNCYALTKLIVKSEISQNGLDLHWSTELSGPSMRSIINNLSNSTSGLSVTLPNGKLSETELTSLIASKPNWTISIV